MNILVIGGTYFCGKAFAKKAVELHTVSVLNRGSKASGISGEAKYRQYRADRHDTEKLADLHLPAFDAVVDFCAYREGDIASMLQALEGKVKQYIFISTCDVYPHRAGTTYREDSPYEEQVFPGEAGEYITGKVALEKELRTQCERLGIAFTVFRPVIIYGPDNYAPREGMYFNWIKKGAQILMPADADGTFQMVYVEDLAEAILKAVGNETAFCKAYNLTGDETVDYAAFEQCLRKVTDAELTAVKLPVADIEAREIPLPFCMRKAESIHYDGSLAKQELGMTYTPLQQGLSETYLRYCEQYAQNMLQEIDKLFDENHPKEALQYMLTELENSVKCADRQLQLLILNELIGYYRQTSEVQPLQEVIEEATRLCETMGLAGTVSYATTLLNCANAYRSIGMLDKSLTLYQTVQEIYQEQLAPEDMQYAGLYNNLSLLYQELGRNGEAKECQMRALEIVTSNQAGFEIAVSYANLANTCVLMEQYEEAERYAKEALRRFEERNLYDAHYCAALSALGMCAYHAGQYKEAQELFETGMKLVEQCIGRNLQYEKLEENRNLCRVKIGEGKEIEEAVEEEIAIKEMKGNRMVGECYSAETGKEQKGMEICRAFYETYGVPMIQQQFPEYENRIAAGLAGEGSDCFGYDDVISRDHDWGPSFCLWVDDEVYEAIGEKLQEAYESLPEEFLGFSTKQSGIGKSRRGVRRISDYYNYFLGTDQYEKMDWRNVEDDALAAAVNGEVFADPEGSFSALRNRLMLGYPEEILFLKLAEDVAKVSQTGQYNNLRMLKRGDALTAVMMSAEMCKAAMKLLHHLNQVFPPHDKWLKQSTRKLPGGEELIGLLERLLNCGTNVEAMEAYAEQIGELLAGLLYEYNRTSDIDPYLDHHTEELLVKAQAAVLGDEELAQKIVRLEFQAFDQVKNEGGRAYCQNDWPTFSIMRKSQYFTWNRTMLLQYYYDFKREFERGHNLITEKYGRMMESTAVDRYRELEGYFPVLSEEKKAVIEQIVNIQMGMVEEFAKEYPHVAGNARNLHTYEDNIVDTSYETYLRGEISTYSDKMLQLYGQYVVQCVRNGENIARMTIENTVQLYGYQSIEELEQHM